MQKQFQPVLPGNDCYSTAVDLGYQGVKSFDQISQICAANPNCKGFRGNIDWWLLSKVENTGPQSADRKCYQAIDTCVRPQTWCTHPGTIYRNVDLIGNGVNGDHLCFDNQGGTGTILRKDNCTAIWPNAVLKRTISSCARPQNWCSHPGAIYKNVDLIGNGVPGDHLCVDNQGGTGTVLRTNNCQPVWPNAKF